MRQVKRFGGITIINGDNTYTVRASWTEEAGAGA